MERLLRDGWSMADPDQGVADAADRLERLGLVHITRREFVLCSDPRDDDFPPPVRHCQGRILLLDGLDEGGDEFRCPECERPVYPILDNKHTHRDVRTHLDPAGVITFIRQELETLGPVRQMVDGVLRVEVDGQEPLVCLLEICSDPRYLAREHARLHPTLFIAVDARNLRERLLPEPWLAQASLADLVTGQTDLPALLDDLLARDPPATLINASLPVYDKVVPVLRPVPVAESQHRAFTVEFDLDCLRIDGVVVTTARAGMQLQVLEILWKRFLDELSAGRSPEEFRPISLGELTDRIDKGDRDEAMDELNVRRAINRLQQEMMETVRRTLGRPMERDDIIQNIRQGTKNRKISGYRINPATVLPKAFATA